ncbi:hypothetical protein ACFPM3_21410 [Streptomyces coeruleoprunus]|uniref:Uncharacterized protein n=1 Tax=Streptomyces coeruleoprunus TaxID=285563 RepID=A0ABV9XKK1_9ACTN
MHDTTELTQAVERFADRLRAAPQSRLQRGAAAQGLGAARELALRAQRMEAPGKPPVTMPDAGVFTVADQLLVAGTDFVEAWKTASAGSRDDASRQEALRAELDEAVALVQEAAATAAL